MNGLPRFAGLAIFLLALNVLVLEVALTRIFSVMTYHHFTYLIIGLALLGFGAAGMVLTVNRRFRGDRIRPRLLADCAWLFGLSLVVCFLLITRTRFEAVAIYTERDFSQLLSLLILLVLATVPFFFGGLCIGYLVSKSGDQINRIYFLDLLGAGFGSLGSLFAISYLGVPPTIFLIAATACLVSVLIGGRGNGGIRWRYIGTAAAALGLTLLTLWNPKAIPVPFSPYKAASPHETEHRWHVIARIDVADPGEGYPNFGGILSPVYGNPQPTLQFRYVFQDGLAPTGIINLQDRDLREMSIFHYYLQGAPYEIRPDGNALVIGPGGGIDVAIALHYGNNHVTAVEINPWTIEYVRNKFNDFAGGLYRREDVEVVNAEGRHYLTRTDRKFDVIQLSGVDTFSALASGAYALSENYLYTLEAMSDFLDHLTDGGVLSFSRWLFTPPRETLRLAVTARRALESRGIPNAGEKIVVIAGYRGDVSPWAETLIKLEPFTAQEVATLRNWADRLGFVVVFDPLLPYEPGGPFDSLRSTATFDPILCAQQFDAALRSASGDFDEYLKGYFYNIKSSRDDSPFFFNFYRLRSLLHPFSTTKGGYLFTRLPLGLLVLLICLVQVFLLSVAFILLPLSGRLASLKGCRGLASVMIYFACIGLGFIAVEIMLLQKLSVFLGGPVYSMAVTLFSLLVFSGIGSYLARKITSAHLQRTGAILLLGVLIAVLTVTWFLNHVVPDLMGLSHPMRCLAAIGILLPVGLLMGMPFPTGIRLAERLDNRLVPWAWSINAFATVLGSIGSILVAMLVGFTYVVFGAALIYFLALLAIRLAPRPVETVS